MPGSVAENTGDQPDSLDIERSLVRFSGMSSVALGQLRAEKVGTVDMATFRHLEAAGLLEVDGEGRTALTAEGTAAVEEARRKLAAAGQIE